ncbi:MAG: metal ABC transporter permease [Planctomycetota bacterium]
MNAPLIGFAWDWTLDGWIVAAGALSAASAAMLGNFLLLRKMSLLGDAISHAVLPGLAIAFLASGERSSVPMFLGAAVVGLLTAVLTEWVHRGGRVDEGASMGVVFTTLFAVGLVLIVRAADRVDLDPGCVLYGAIELTPLDRWNVFGWPVPRVVAVLSVVLVVNAAFVGALFKELRIASFDPQLATASGIPAAWVHYALMTLVAVTAVASFEAVGNILVVAMMIAPPAAARLLTDRLAVMIPLSVLIAVAAAPIGHLAAIAVPGWFGLGSTTTAGAIAVAAGGLLALAVGFSPTRGLVPRAVRRRRLALRILAEDVLGLLYRQSETHDASATLGELRAELACGRLELALVRWRLGRLGWLEATGGGVHLTPDGSDAARRLIRSHRLWERYLVERADRGAETIHPSAERLEHFTDRSLREQLDAETSGLSLDPHGRAIPAEASPGDGVQLGKDQSGEAPAR